jgi:hypothetical protein
MKMCPITLIPECTKLRDLSPEAISSYEFAAEDGIRMRLRFLSPRKCLPFLKKLF